MADRDDASQAQALALKAITPDDSPRSAMDIMADPELRDLAKAKLGVGDVAHEIDLPLLDFSQGVKKETGRTFRLSEAAASRPVALIFGSYT